MLSRRRAVFAALEYCQRIRFHTKGREHQRLLFKCDCRTLRAICFFRLWGDGEGSDLSTDGLLDTTTVRRERRDIPEAKEVSHFFLAGLCGDVFDLETDV